MFKLMLSCIYFYYKTLTPIIYIILGAAGTQEGPYDVCGTGRLPLTMSAAGSYTSDAAATATAASKYPTPHLIH